MSSPGSDYSFTADQFRRAAKGEEPIRGKVISANRGLAVKAAEGWARRNPEMEIQDLVQAGSVGLVRAVGKFDPDRGYQFSTYAMYWIVKEIRLEVASSISSGRATKTEAQLFMSGRLPEERRAAYRAATGDHQCIYSPAGEDGATLVDMMEDSESNDLEVAETRAQFEAVIECAQDACSPQQFEALCLRYGVVFSEPLSYEKIADDLGLGSAAQAKALVEAALDIVRAEMLD